MLLLTGFPGFIGRRLARALLDDPAARVVALVEPRMVERARAAAAALPGGDRVEVVPGDITERRLGLGEEAYARLTAAVTQVFHLAAIYDLSVPLEVAQKVNVEGTGNVLELCRDCERLERHVYVSTAYVAGTRKGVVYEHELTLGQAFKNHYESTKFQAEVWVRQSMPEIPTVILRPAIVVGDSRTGETQKFDGPYYILRSISMLTRHGLPMARFGKAQAAFNAVPVDFIVSAILAASRDERAIGRTLHLTDPAPLSTRELTEILTRSYSGKSPRGSLPPWLVEASLRSALLRKVFAGTPRESIRYLNHPVRFDTRQATELLADHGVVCPPFPQYADTLVRFFKAHERDPALDPRA